MLKFNMGCGHNQRPGYVNVDSTPACEPDQVWDLEVTPWPWETGCAQEILFIHSLEHMGGDPKIFLAIMSELYRIAAPDCRVVIHVPHPRHDNFIGDPTHVRPVNRQMLTLFDRQLNDEWKAKGYANTTLAHYTGVDFEIVEYQQVVGEPYRSQLKRGELSSEDVLRLASERLNVIEELRITLRARHQPT
jgi:hypothetical protein